MRWAYIFEIPLGYMTIGQKCLEFPDKNVCFDMGFPQDIPAYVKVTINYDVDYAGVLEMLYNGQENVLTRSFYYYE